MNKKFAGVLAATVMLVAGPALAQACDVKLGKKTFRACAACHKLDEGKHGVGPSLHGVVGRAAGTADGYKYSKSMTEFGSGGKVWDAALLDEFLTKPKALVKGTKMSYGGLKKDDRRAALICYLDSVK